MAKRISHESDEGGSGGEEVVLGCASIIWALWSVRARGRSCPGAAEPCAVAPSLDRTRAAAVRAPRCGALRLRACLMKRGTLVLRALSIGFHDAS